ncbi:hypothetical protein ABZ951_29435 [Streptomyces sp. NPDC046215]|uniref:hypothetical protein n=1 Tax=Streptomyces sp. NPDC046215 TaxID=3155774 RepID=UPI0033F245EB
MVARGTYEVLRRVAPGGARVWERSNHAGRSVGLWAGPAAVAGTALAVGSGPGLRPRARGAAVLAVAAAGACGAYDDFAGAGDPRRGFRAHLTALRDGEVTSGTVKLAGISAAALPAGAVLKERPLDKLLAATVIAGSAHLVNLLDVRPGRAAGAVLAIGAGQLARGGAPAAAPVGAAAALFGADLGERTMLGDAGAHALGAGLGIAAVAAAGRAGLAAQALALVAVAAAMDAKNHLCE